MLQRWWDQTFSGVACKFRQRGRQPPANHGKTTALFWAVNQWLLSLYERQASLKRIARAERRLRRVWNDEQMQSTAQLEHWQTHANKRLCQVEWVTRGGWKTIIAKNESVLFLKQKRENNKHPCNNCSPLELAFFGCRNPHPLFHMWWWPRQATAIVALNTQCRAEFE